MTDDLGRLRVLCGSLGLPQDTWSHLPPEEEERRLTEYGHALLDSIEDLGMTLEQYLLAADPVARASSPRIVRLPDPRARARRPKSLRR